jgi:hypothetical protein
MASKTKSPNHGVRELAETITRIKMTSVKIANKVLDISKDIAEEDSSILEEFISKFKDAKLSDHSEHSDHSEGEETPKEEDTFYAGPYEEVVPSKEEAGIVIEKAIFRLSKIARRVVQDIKPFEHDIVKGRDYITRHTSRYPFLSSVYNGDYYDLKGHEALAALLKDLRHTKKMFEDEDKIVNYSHKNYNDLYSE